MRQAGISVDNNFSKGLITEASGLNFPENSCTETWNCVFDLTGSVERRRGLDFEVNYNTKAIARSSSAIVTYLWKNPNGEASVNLLVAQIGDHLYYWDCGTGTEPISSLPITDSTNLNTFTPSGGTTPTSGECQFSIGNGKLFVVHPYCESFYVTYNSTTQAITETQINIKIRDFEGLDDGLDIDNRPTSSLAGLTDNHKYNLYNQGWNTTNLTTWDGSQTTMPSNCDVMWRFKNSSDAFDMATLANVISGNSPAPKGHYILSVYEQDRTTAAGFGAIPTVSTNKQRASTVAFFSGRVWYSGINYTGFNSKIYFTQIVERDAQYGYCYQQNDPTAEDTFDLLPSDGGVISIPDAGTIVKLFAVQAGIAVFATNGVWFITGSSGLGFTANDYSIIRLSSTPAITPSSFVDVGGYPCWWNLDGIYILVEGGQGGAGLQVQSLTDTTIKSFYQSLPPATKRNTKGAYNKLTRVIQWLYTSTEVGTVDEQYNFDSVLIFDTRTQAFYPWALDNTHAVKLNGLFVVEGSSGTITSVDVIDNGSNTVVDDLGNTVVVYTLGNTVTSPTFKYFVSYNDGSNKFTIAEVSNNRYVDWYQYSSTASYDSYFVSGYRVRGNAIYDFQSNYVTFYSANSAKFYVSGVWDYSNTTSSYRWSSPQLVDNTNNSYYDTVAKRLKIRGRGKALQLRVDSYSTEPFTIYGWSMLASANSTP